MIFECPNILLTDSIGTPFDRDNSGHKGVRDQVEGQALFNSAQIGNFLQITVQLLIGDFWPPALKLRQSLSGERINCVDPV